jgi:hypothetical protein
MMAMLQEGKNEEEGAGGAVVFGSDVPRRLGVNAARANTIDRIA